MSGERGDAADGSRDVSGQGDRAHPVFEGAFAGSGVPWSPHRGQDQYRLHLYGSEGREGEEHLYLQCLRPSGMLSGAGLSGYLLYHRRSGHDRGHAGDERNMEEAGGVQCGGV